MTIAFNKTGYDPFIDFLKSFCIIVVIFCHGFPYLNLIGYPIWGVQIPLFILIQVFHCFKRDPKPVNWRVILRRVLIPFVVIELIVFCILWCSGGYESVGQLVLSGLIEGGYGPGSYYPWVYLQMAIFIPCLRPICDKLGSGKSFLFFLILSEAIEIVCSIVNIPDAIYRMLCLRYVMLIWFGWMWAKDGIKLNWGTGVTALISLGAVIYFGYFSGGNEPWFYETGWTTHRWPCYFWVSTLFVWILYQFYTVAIKREFVKREIKVLATSSYEIFLIQMAFYAVFPLKYLSFIGNVYLRFVLWFLMAFFVSIIGGVGLTKLEHRLNNGRKSEKTVVDGHQEA